MRILDHEVESDVQKTVSDRSRSNESDGLISQVIQFTELVELSCYVMWPLIAHAIANSDNLFVS